MPMYNLIEYSNNYSETSGILCQYYRDKLFLDTNGAIADFPGDSNNSGSLDLNEKTCSTRDNGTEDVKIMVPLK